MCAAPLLTPSQVQSERQGPNRLVSVRDFIAAHSGVQEHLQRVCAELDKQQEHRPDLQVEQLAVDAPFERIERAIADEVARVLRLQR